MEEKRVSVKKKKELSRREPIDFKDPRNKQSVCGMMGCHEPIVPGTSLCDIHYSALAQELLEG